MKKLRLFLSFLDKCSHNKTNLKYIKYNIHDNKKNPTYTFIFCVTLIADKVVA